jgi:hypothetical protein
VLRLRGLCGKGSAEFSQFTLRHLPEAPAYCNVRFPPIADLRNIRFRPIADIREMLPVGFRERFKSTPPKQSFGGAESSALLGGQNTLVEIALVLLEHVHSHCSFPELRRSITQDLSCTVHCGFVAGGLKPLCLCGPALGDAVDPVELHGDHLVMQA